MNLQAYYDLFVHRGDVFAAQAPGGNYAPVERPLTSDEIAEHLAGYASYGVYTTLPSDHTVKYLVFDLDTHDEPAWLELRRLVVRAVTTAQVSNGKDPTFDCLMAETSGNKGKHIWLFFSEPVAARKARYWGNEAVVKPWVQWVVSLSPDGETSSSALTPSQLEMFPKQDFVAEGGYGNLVKLPFGVHAVSGNRSEIISAQGWANDVTEVHGLDPVLLPEPPVGQVGQGPRPQGGERVTPFPCVTEILDNGVGKGLRDNALFHIALFYKGHGLDVDLALQQCLRANENFQPPLTEREVKSKVESAYRGTYSSGSCGAGWLRQVCPGPCKAGWTVASAIEQGTLHSAKPGASVEVEVKNVDSDGQRLRVRVGHPDADNEPTFVVMRGR